MHFMNPHHSGRLCLPPPDRSEILLDFDGTITQKDILDELVARYSIDQSWIDLERQWQSGRIGSRECLSKEFALLRITAAELAEFLETIELDPGIERLMQLLSHLQIPTTIVSDGIESFIEQFLQRIDPLALPENLTIRANAIHHHGDRLEIVNPHASPACESAAAHCKCRSAVLMHTPGRQSIYIGDGLSDLCPARRAHFVFAKGRLAEALAYEEIPYIPFRALDDVVAILAASWSRYYSPLRSICSCGED